MSPADEGKGCPRQILPHDSGFLPRSLEIKCRRYFCMSAWTSTIFQASTFFYGGYGRFLEVVGTTLSMFFIKKSVGIYSVEGFFYRGAVSSGAENEFALAVRPGEKARCPYRRLSCRLICFVRKIRLRRRVELFQSPGVPNVREPSRKYLMFRRCDCRCIFTTVRRLRHTLRLPRAVLLPLCGLFRGICETI